MQNPLPLKLRTAATIALAFGALTILSGGAVLFFSGPARQAAGNYVPFVLWFNFFAGFAYIATGAGLYFAEKWAVHLSWIIAISTLIVFAAFAFVAFTGTPYEPRTFAALTLRSGVWFVIAYIARSVIKD